MTRVTKTYLGRGIKMDNADLASIVVALLECREVLEKHSVGFYLSVTHEDFDLSFENEIEISEVW